MGSQTAGGSTLGASISIDELVAGLSRKFFNVQDFSLAGGAVVILAGGNVPTARIEFDVDNDEARATTIVPPGATSLSSAKAFYHTTLDDDFVITVYATSLGEGINVGLGTNDSVAFAADTLTVSANLLALDISGAFDAASMIVAGELLTVKFVITSFVAGNFYLHGVELRFA